MIGRFPGRITAVFVATMLVAAPAVSAFAASARVIECCCGLHSALSGCGCPSCPSRDKHPRRDGVLALRGCLPVALGCAAAAASAMATAKRIAIPRAEEQGVQGLPIPAPMSGYVAAADVRPP